MLLKTQEADRVDRAGFKAAVDGHHLGVGSDDLRSHALQQRLRQTLVHRQARHVERDLLEPMIGST